MEENLSPQSRHSQHSSVSSGSEPPKQVEYSAGTGNRYKSGNNYNLINKQSTRRQILQGKREEDSYPVQLNCNHYEKLLRIHVMLATVAQSQEQKVQYLLDAKFCVYQIFKQSFQTLQSLEDNAAKYLNINPG